MFKNLRKKLSQVEEELEAALDEELEKQLEAELASATEVADPEEAVPEAAPEPAEPPAPEPVARTEPEPEPAPEVAAEAAPERERRPEPTSGPRDEPAPAAAPKPAPTPDAAPRPAARPPSAPTPDAAAPTRRDRVRKPGAPVKKSDKDLAAEIEASLEAELGQAMEAQKEVEQTIRATASDGVVVRLSDERLDEILWELELALLESDVALPVVEAIKNNVREQLRESRIPKRGAGEVVQRALMTAVRRVLNEPFDFDAYIEKAEKPTVIMFVGVNGTGKTTSIAKIAHRLKKNGRSVVLAAGDTFRAGAVQQLQQHADRLGVKLIKHEGKNADPAAVAFDAIDHARSRHKDVVLLDTAGRQQTNTNLMNEMEKIKRVAQPDLILFVGDSLAGNDAVTQADKFNDVVGIDGVILTKVDADAKGGAALSVAYAIGKPLVFIGLGQEYEDQVPFDRDWMIARLFGEETELQASAA